MENKLFIKLPACFRRSVQSFCNYKHHQDQLQHCVLMLKLQSWWEPPRSRAEDKVSSAKQLSANGTIPRGWSLVTLSVRGQTTLSPSSGSSWAGPHWGVTALWSRSQLGVYLRLGECICLAEVTENMMWWLLSLLLLGTLNTINKCVKSLSPTLSTRTYTHRDTEKQSGSGDHKPNLSLKPELTHLSAKYLFLSWYHA